MKLTIKKSVVKNLNKQAMSPSLTDQVNGGMPKVAWSQNETCGYVCGDCIPY
ncbi:hypothetical protein [Pseudoalteromonas xiamenensis]|uniref:Uncharacterized protein n=1 Tax=Pseudoalteromonas xiamenensis TaxID=882626 RepID=A0A975DEH0_9GAMM|nr:hypothetical protein [Pseudoalteromonas xiamenensis]QTH70333.1 hypothetical protein J5O05_09910 [Pseudoalteromonas xiamenensis]WMN58599.1 hypothetical protein NI389_10045 [Pseudoalteromonas xiamenensis]